VTGPAAERYARLVPEQSPFPRLFVFPLLMMAAVLAGVARVNADLLLRSAHCALRESTAIPCPTCGGTMAAIDLAEGRLMAALTANPLLTLIALGGGLWCLYAVAATFLPRWRRSLDLSRGAVKTVRWLVALLLAANWAYEVAAR
jgi:hypothetical protein